MINNIEEYLSALKKELSGSDRATIQDALSDAEEYLRTALDSAVNDKVHMKEAEALAPILERYGQPAEVAAAYKLMEKRTPPSFTQPVYKKEPQSILPPPPPPPEPKDTRPLLARFFGVFAEPRAWGSFFFLLFTLGTGIIYFSWVMTGFFTSFGLMFAMLLGVPLMFLFLLSVRGIAVVEGRLIEALVGVRMPRRPIFTRKDVGFWQKVKSIFTERQTWTALVYMLLQLPLGIIYFSVFVSLMSVAVSLVFWPIIAAANGIPLFTTSVYEYTVTAWLIPIWMISGVLLLTATMHLIKYTARFHAAFAKVMLVRE